MPPHFILSYVAFYLREKEFWRVHLAAMSRIANDFFHIY